MSRILKRLAFLMVALTICTSMTYRHIHDDACGYNAETDSGCEFEVNPIIDGDPPIG